MTFVFPEPQRPSVPISGAAERFPVHRIYCVGRNYAAHAREMGKDPDREPPFFFMKAPDALVASGSAIPYPPRTANLHHEIELVVAIGKGGRSIPASRRWTTYLVTPLATISRGATCNSRPRMRAGPGIRASLSRIAPQSPPSSPASQRGHLSAGRIWLDVNGESRQRGDISQLIWSIPELIAELSTLFSLAPGDLIYTGTPSGVGPVMAGDRMEGGIDGLPTLVNTIAPSEP